MIAMIRRYSELSKLKTYEERFKYLKVSNQIVGDATFGALRQFNQRFYRSPEWKRIRDQVILRDNGCDLGIPGLEIYGKVLIHHMNPITIDDIENMTPNLLNPEYLISVSYSTHQALHYTDSEKIFVKPVVRTPNDTCPWKGGCNDREHTIDDSEASRDWR